jgi:hypothetical protein
VASIATDVAMQAAANAEAFYLYRQALEPNKKQ